MPQESEAPARQEPQGDVKRPLQRLLEALTGGAVDMVPQQTSNERIISPVSIDRLVDILLETGVRDETAEPQEKTVRSVQARIKGLTGIVQQLSRSFVNIYVSDGLGRIYHPLYSVPTVESRLALLAQLLAKTVLEVTEDVARLHRSKTMSPQEYADFATEAELAIQLSFLVLPEVYNQLLTLYYINAPPEMRPPLVNAALGYEIVGASTRQRKR